MYEKCKIENKKKTRRVVNAVRSLPGCSANSAQLRTRSEHAAHAGVSVLHLQVRAVLCVHCPNTRGNLPRKKVQTRRQGASKVGVEVNGAQQK